MLKNIPYAFCWLFYIVTEIWILKYSDRTDHKGRSFFSISNSGPINTLDTVFDNILDKVEDTKHCGNRNYLSFKAIGRLGNHMFQVASTLGIAEKSGLHVNIPSSVKLNCFNTFNRRQFSQLQIKSYHPRDLTFESEVFELGCEYNLLDSVMQSWKYFGHVTDDVIESFHFTSAILENVVNFYESIALVYNNEPSTFVTVQIRRSDFVKDYAHLINGISLNYIANAMRHYHQEFLNPKFIIVSDDISWCKDNLKNLTYNIVFSENHSPCEDLAILASTNHSIITSGSSFGWWGAFLSSGHVTYYPRWLKTGSWYNLHFTEADYFLPQWTMLPRT